MSRGYRGEIESTVFCDPVTSSSEYNKNLVQKEKEQLHLAPLALIIVRPKGRPRRGAMAGIQKKL